MNDRQRAGRVGAVADLLSVSLRTVEAHLPEPAQIEGPVELDVSWETSAQQIDPESLRYTYRLAVAGSAAHDFHIECEFELDYRMPENFEATEEDLTAFGEISASFSAFPYARELVQSLTTRASLPPLVLGTLRAPIDPPASTISEPVPSQ